MTQPRTLPLRLEPLPGEALDSWLEALAHRLHTPLGNLMAGLGLPARKGRPGQRSAGSPCWHRRLPPSRSPPVSARDRSTR